MPAHGLFAEIEYLIEFTALRLMTVPDSRRFLASIAGIPGSGKTTLAKLVVDGLNRKYGSEIALMVPMDGYHLTRAQLSAMPDSEKAHFCRGAHWTFDPAALSLLITECKQDITETTIFAPTFDHAGKDPVENGISILPRHRVLIFEGNYLVLSTPEEWASVAKSFDHRWFVEVSEDVARERLAKRHLAAGICQTYEDGLDRAERNDLVNGRFIVANRLPVEHTIQSVEDERLKS